MTRRMWLVLAFASGCAAPHATPSSPVSLTSASFGEPYRNIDAAQTALHENEPAVALSMADLALEGAPNDPWALYERGTALAKLGRTDEAVLAFSRAAALYGDALPHGKELAMYGRARTLDMAGRCTEARASYESYAGFVRPFDPTSAEMAITYGRECRELTPAVPDLMDVDDALMSADYTRALSLATDREHVARTQGDRAWIDEARGMALTGLQRGVEAADAFERAAVGYESTDNRLGRARALYGEALALRAAAQCEKATRAYERYATFVRSFAPEDADMAERYARDCPGLAPKPEKTPASTHKR